MKKILFVRTLPYDINPKSYNVQPIGMGKAFCKKGYEFDYIALKKHNPSKWVFYEYDGIKATCIEKKRIRFFRMGINFDICKRDFLKQYDIVITQEYYQIMTYIMSNNSDNIVMYSGPYWNMFMLPFMSIVYDRLFTKRINDNIKIKFVKSELAKKFMSDKGYVNLINIGVGLDIDRFNERITLSDMTEKLIKYMNNFPCILYIGSLDENKNFPFLLKVFENISKKYDDLRFVIIGKSKQSFKKKLLGKKNSSYEKNIFKNYSQEIKEKILRIEKIDNAQLKYIYPLAKAFLLPSKNEIFGMVLLEAMYLGAPVVSSYNGGSVSLIRNEDFGQIIDNFDVIKWTKAVEKYIIDPIYVEKVKNNAHHLVETEYTWDSIVDKMISYIEKEYRFNEANN